MRKIPIRLIISVLLLISFMPDPSYAKWIKVAEEEGIVVFGQDAVEGIIPFKAVGIIKSSKEKILEILKDSSNKPKWSPKLKSVKIHEVIGSRREVFHFSEYYSTPWPAYDREFLLKGEINFDEEGKIFLKAKSLSSKEILNLANGDHVLAEVQKLNVILKGINPNETEVTFEFHGDMKGWMPIWLMNLIQKKWPLRFIQGLRKYIKQKNS